MKTKKLKEITGVETITYGDHLGVVVNAEEVSEERLQEAIAFLSGLLVDVSAKK